MNRVVIASDNGLSPATRQFITWTNTDLLSIEPLRTYLSEIRIKIQKISFVKIAFENVCAMAVICLGGGGW